ncbi:MAG: hypothetical protein QM534_06950 [Sediminibacterium sp.]|nr:hypothetical protein [Sediminibacterium sp.]
MKCFAAPKCRGWDTNNGKIFNILLKRFKKKVALSPKKEKNGKYPCLPGIGFYTFVAL